MIRTQQEYQAAKRNLDKLHQLRSEMLEVTSLDGNAILHAVPNGVEKTTDLGVTQQEFEAMSAIEQQQLIGEYLADVVEIFVK